MPPSGYLTEETPLVDVIHQILLLATKLPLHVLHYAALRISS